MSVRSDVKSGGNQCWEWRPEAGDAEDGKTTSDASRRGARASDAGLIFADEHSPKWRLASFGNPTASSSLIYLRLSTPVERSHSLSLTRLHLPHPTPHTSSPSPGPSTSPSPWEKTLGPSLSSPIPLYNQQYTLSLSGSFPRMKMNSSHISGRQAILNDKVLGARTPHKDLQGKVTLP